MHTTSSTSVVDRPPLGCSHRNVPRHFRFAGPPGAVVGDYRLMRHRLYSTASRGHVFHSTP